MRPSQRYLASAAWLIQLGAKAFDPLQCIKHRRGHHRGDFSHQLEHRLQRCGDHAILQRDIEQNQLHHAAGVHQHAD